MSESTAIQWCDSTVNPSSGCQGCELKIPGRKGTCYAVPIHENRLAKSFPDKYAADFHEIRLVPGRMAEAAGWSDLAGKPRPKKPWLSGMPRIVFVGDMGDLFSRDVPFEFIRDEVFAAIASAKGSRHLWMLLTKQPRRLADFSAWHAAQGLHWPANLICGTSVTTQATTGRVGDLLGVPGPLFVSAEPLRERITLRPFLGSGGVSLVIAGGESGDGSMPCDFAWLRSLRDECREAGVSYFCKQVGSKPYGDWKHGDPPTYHLSQMRAGMLKTSVEVNQCKNGRWNLRDGHGGDWSEWPTDLRIRQFPAIPLLAENPA